MDWQTTDRGQVIPFTPPSLTGIPFPAPDEKYFTFSTYNANYLDTNNGQQNIIWTAPPVPPPSFAEPYPSSSNSSTPYLGGSNAETGSSGLMTLCAAGFDQLVKDSEFRRPSTSNSYSSYVSDSDDYHSSASISSRSSSVSTNFRSALRGLKQQQHGPFSSDIRPSKRSRSVTSLVEQGSNSDAQSAQSFTSSQQSIFPDQVAIRRNSSNISLATSISDGPPQPQDLPSLACATHGIVNHLISSKEQPQRLTFSPSSTTDNSSNGMGAIVEAKEEWIKAKPRIRKSVRRRIERLLPGSHSPGSSSNSHSSKQPQLKNGFEAIEPPTPLPMSVRKKRMPTSANAKGKGKEGVSRSGDNESRRKSITSDNSSTSVTLVRKKPSAAMAKPPKASSRTSISLDNDNGYEKDDEGSEGDLDDGGDDGYESDIEEFFHPPTEFPPKPWTCAESPFRLHLPLKKIAGSQMDRLPDLETRMQKLEVAIEQYMSHVSLRAFENSLLPGKKDWDSVVMETWVKLGGVGSPPWLK